MTVALVALLMVGPGVEAAASKAPAIMAEVDRLATVPLWPGFDPNQTPVAIYDGHQTWLFRHPSPPQGFEPLNGGEAWVMAGQYEKVRANTSEEIGGVPTATLLLNDADQRAPLELAGITIHETFHVFERAHHPSWMGNEVDLFTYPNQDVDPLQLRKLETQALSRALRATNAQEIIGWTKAFLITRQERFAKLPPEAAAYERGTELNEGLALYVEDRATGASQPPVDDVDQYAADEVRKRAYAVGEGLALLLDRVAPSWKTRLEQDDSLSLDGLLGEVVADSAVAPKQFTTEERAAAQTSAESAVETLKQGIEEQRREFFRRPGWRLEVVIEGGEPLWPQGFDPLNIRRIGENEVFHSRWIKLGNSRGTLEVLNRASVTLAAGPHPLFNGVVKLFLTGIAGEPDIEESEGKVSVRCEGFSAEFAHARVERKDQRLTVTLTNPEQQD